MNRPFWRRHLHRLRKHLGWITLAVLGQGACRTLIPESVLRGAVELGGNFLQTFGSMYGIIVAFAMFVVWQQHNDTQIAVEREAVSLGELYRSLGWYHSWSGRETVRASLRRYAALVPQRYQAGAPPAEDELPLLRASTEAFLGHAPGNPTEERLYGQTLDLFHELNEAREHRITVAGLRLPEALTWFLYLGAAFCVGTLWLLFVDAWVVQALFTAGMTWVVVAAVSIVIDLDDPFTGDFNVVWQRFHQTAEQMEQPAQPVAPVARAG